jgi:uncharacterized protein (DUF486 family)
MPIAPALPGLWPYILPVLLLCCSNIFMSFAWYGNLKFKAWSMVFAILVSWGIAFVEYCFAVPANRIGNAIYSPAELKSIQEVITLIVFAGVYRTLFPRTAFVHSRNGFRSDWSGRGVGLSRSILKQARSGSSSTSDVPRFTPSFADWH